MSSDALLPMDAFARYRAGRPGPGSGPVSAVNIAILLLLVATCGAWWFATPRLSLLTPERATGIIHTIPKGVLTIVQLDVGQGDGTFIHTPSGKVILIDCGEGTHKENQYSRQYPATMEVVIPFLKLHGIKDIDLLILTHPDSDHGGGMEELIRWIYKNGGKVHQMIDAGAKKSAVFYKNILLAVEDLDVPYATVLDPKSKIPAEYPAGTFPGFKGGTLIGVDPLDDPDVALQIFGPLRLLKEANNNSVVTRLQYGDFSFLSAGDAEDQEENDLFEFWGPLLRSKLHFAPHHGSKTSDNPYWLKRVNPEIIATSSHGPVFGHPAGEVIENWRRYFKPMPRIYVRTDMNGDIWYRTDGAKLAIRTQFKYKGEEQWTPAKMRDWSGPYRAFKSNPPTTYEECHPVPETDKL